MMPQGEKLMIWRSTPISWRLNKASWRRRSWATKTKTMPWMVTSTIWWRISPTSKDRHPMPSLTWLASKRISQKLEGSRKSSKVRPSIITRQLRRKSCAIMTLQRLSTRPKTHSDSELIRWTKATRKSQAFPDKTKNWVVSMPVFAKISNTVVSTSKTFPFSTQMYHFPYIARNKLGEVFLIRRYREKSDWQKAKSAES